MDGTTSGGAPRQCRVGDRQYVVTEIHSHWVTGTPWWLTGRDVDTHTWRVTVAPGSRVVDLHCTGEHWRITRVGGVR